MIFQNTLSFAQELDQKDPLAKFREQFHIPTVNGNQQIYLCGNSLGLQPKTAREAINQIRRLGQFRGRRPFQRQKPLDVLPPFFN